MVTGFNIQVTELSQNQAENTSRVKVALIITWNGGSYNATGNASGELTVDGVQYNFKAKFNEAQLNTGSEEFYAVELDVPHYMDGSKTLYSRARFITQTAVGTVTDTDSTVLTQIPRESTIAATSGDIEGTSLITVVRRNSTYTHSIAYAFCGLTGYMAGPDDELTDKETKLSDTSLIFHIPKTFYAAIGNAPSALCTLTITTYNGSTQIGQKKTGHFAVSCNEALCKPEITGKVVDVNEATIALTGNPQALVRHLSTALCTLDATAKNSATLDNGAVSGLPLNGDPGYKQLTASREIRAVDMDKFVFTVWDCRGFSNACSVEPEIVEYIPLTAVVTAERETGASDRATLSVEGKWFPGSFGAEKNTLAIEYRVGTGAVQTVAQENIQKTGNSYRVSVALDNLDYQSNYSIQVSITDASGTTLSRTATVKKSIPVFDWGEEDFAFHVGVSMDKALNVGGTLDVMGSLKLEGKYLFDLIYPVGSIYMSVNSTSPQTLFFGTWERLKDRFLLAAGDSYGAGATGGAAEVTLTAEQMPKHSHSVPNVKTTSATDTGGAYAESWGAGSGSRDIVTGEAGQGEAHNNMPPYIAVYMWKRIS